jgi:hypothetical protein
LEKIAALYVGTPITIYLDNARCQRCALVIEKAHGLNIESCFLPQGSKKNWQQVKSPTGL